MIHENKVIG